MNTQTNIAAVKPKPKSNFLLNIVEYDRQTPTFTEQTEKHGICLFGKFLVWKSANFCSYYGISRVLYIKT